VAISIQCTHMSGIVGLAIQKILRSFDISWFGIILSAIANAR